MGVVILDDEWIEKQAEVPLEYRRYIRREDLSKLPKGLKIYQGVRGGLYFDAREYERLTGEKPDIGEAREVEAPREEKPRRRKGLRLYGLSYVKDPVRRRQFEEVFNDLNERIDFRRSFGLKNGKIILASEDKIKSLVRHFPEAGVSGVYIRRKGIIINADDSWVSGHGRGVMTLPEVLNLINKYTSTVLMNARKKKTGAFWPIKMNARSFITILLHEMGHYVWEKRSDISEREELKNLFRKENFITYYAEKNPNEFWAEHFVWFILAPKLHEDIYPEVHKFMVRWFGRHRINVKKIWKNLGVK